MRKIYHSMILVSALIICCLITSKSVWGQTPSPTIDISRFSYEYFPTNLVCSEIIGNDEIRGIGPTVGPITIGETTLDDLLTRYANSFPISIEQGIREFEIIIVAPTATANAGVSYHQFLTCVEEGVIMVIEGDVEDILSPEELIELDVYYHSDDYTFEPPTNYVRFGITHMVEQYGLPDVVTYGTHDSDRVAFWFEKGVAGVFYVRYDEPNIDYPPTFGGLSKIIYFPFQDVEGYENRYPFNQSFPEERFIQYILPYLAIDKMLPTERNPFDFDAILESLTPTPSP